MMISKQRYWLYGILVLAVFGTVLISGCVQQGVECEVKEDCPDKACFAKECASNNCFYSQAIPCPECDDNDECTDDSFDYGKQACVNKGIFPCCGNGNCESYYEETYLTCPQDCPTPGEVLEGKIEISDYPKLGQVFVDLYAYQGFSDEEIDFMKVGLELYEEKPKLKAYPKEALLYQMSRSGGYDFYDAGFFNQTLIPLAENITAGAEDDLAALKAIHIWVREVMTYDNFHYPYVTPESILEEKYGKCGEYAVLITALSKAAGIPARVVSSSELIPQKLSHAWVEIYTDGDWIPIPSTGAMDYDNNGVIEYSDLSAFNNNRIREVFIMSPYSIRSHHWIDITFGYNNYIPQQMIAEVEDMLKENYNTEANDNLESAKDTLSPWENEKSTGERHKIGREAMEHLIRAMAILRDNVTGDEIQVVFLEDFPIFKHVWDTKEEKITPKILIGITESADIKNPNAFWEGFQKALVEANPKVLYIFDSADEDDTNIMFSSDCRGVDFCMLRTIDELIKNEGLNTELNFVLYWSNGLEKIEFLDYDDIEPVTSLTKLFHENALDFFSSFTEAVDSVKENVTETNFYLPPKFEGKYNYRIGAVGPLLKEGKYYSGGYSLAFKMVIETSFGGLPLILQLQSKPGGDGFPEYTNLIILNESSDVSRPEEKDGEYYYEICPSEFVNLTAGQNLLIEREGNFIKITETGKP
jgi:hypothetical protein